MAIERTFSMIKPDATRRNLTGAITADVRGGRPARRGLARVWMSRREAEGFYAVHKGARSSTSCVEFMSSGPTVVQVLEGENAIAKNREVMGATNPADAAEGTIRKDFALSIGENSVHGSDAPETAAQEIGLLVLQTEDRRADRRVSRRDGMKKGSQWPPFLFRTGTRSPRASDPVPTTGCGVVGVLGFDPAAGAAVDECSFFQNGALVFRKSMTNDAASKAAWRWLDAQRRARCFRPARCGRSGG